MCMIGKTKCNTLCSINGKTNKAQEYIGIQPSTHGDAYNFIEGDFWHTDVQRVLKDNTKIVDPALE